MCKILYKPVVNVAFNETMSFETQIMSSETSVSWQSRSLLRVQVAKATNRQKNGSAEESTLYTRAHIIPHAFDH